MTTPTPFSSDRPSDMANGVPFFASDGSSYTTGTEPVIDDGPSA